ncbi:hypothetical protein [Oceanobacillus damuensis]|uniref:hypothetical protein n=1 Tax=Oceanobacillus damuensis TaxID=937928 RepID=UPI00082EC14F|nr:hypothetical protein [Oceanobacillus damuensis]
MKYPLYMLAGALLIAFLLAGCSMKSEEKAISEANAAAEHVFHNETETDTNYKIDNNSIYIPAHLEVESSDDSNIILVNGSQTYIVFNNPIEAPVSELNYNAATTEDALVLESFADADKFGYIRILPDEGEGYEMQIGAGGAKITTFTSKGKMAEDAEELMKLAKSIVNQD